jgi:hypothetical protein
LESIGYGLAQKEQPVNAHHFKVPPLSKKQDTTMRKNSFPRASATSTALMLLLLGRTLLLLDVRGCAAAKTGRSSFGLRRQQNYLHLFRGGSLPEPSGKIYRTLQVQIVHRHGDRTPITPMKDEEWWAKTLVPPDMLEKISSNTNLIAEEEELKHGAGGRGPFGKLTQLGLFQMVDLGTRLREELVSPDKHHDDHHAYDVCPTSGHKHYKYVWHPKRPLHPKDIKVLSTNFPRTIQSVQGVLVGLFPDGTEGSTIDIDARHTNILIPDPQPRQTPEQEALEAELALQPHLKLKEQEMLPLAIRVTAALRDSLGEEAFGVAFGVGEEDKSDNPEERPLAWGQLAEITKCLQVRNRLPPTVSAKDQETISKHTAWRWFESLRHPRLAFLAMNRMTSRMIDAMHRHDKEPPVIIYSGHDSTLIGLLSAFRLELPSVWPEYGSYLKIELMEDVTPGDGEKEHVVRFSLNGNVLRCIWDEEKPLNEIPLRLLANKIKTEGAVTI